MPVQVFPSLLFTVFIAGAVVFSNGGPEKGEGNGGRNFDYEGRLGGCSAEIPAHGGVETETGEKWRGGRREEGGGRWERGIEQLKMVQACRACEWKGVGRSKRFFSKLATKAV